MKTKSQYQYSLQRYVNLKKKLILKWPPSFLNFRQNHNYIKAAESHKEQFGEISTVVFGSIQTTCMVADIEHLCSAFSELPRRSNNRAYAEVSAVRSQAQQRRGTAVRST